MINQNNETNLLNWGGGGLKWQNSAEKVKARGGMRGNEREVVSPEVRRAGACGRPSPARGSGRGRGLGGIASGHVQCLCLSRLIITNPQTL